MARRSRRHSPEQLRTRLICLLSQFEHSLQTDNLRDKVRALVLANYLLRDLGSSLIEDRDGRGARGRILAYLRKYSQIPVKGEELMVVAGISEYARRVRELRILDISVLSSTVQDWG